ncbi:uncharacterized protein LOC119732346 [Patiria miniata]|uniref:Uncharacterized protein n=1 Tax=Patiria miniata TaxID=46514 RepID=A0A914AD24_PATMI|nr:uncharacterized protein LOC119732346 [Patiria miniata]
MSEELRKAGNVKYKAALVEGLSPVLKCSRLQSAINLYARAASEATGPRMASEWSSATKNLGMATKRMAQEYMKDKQDTGYAKTLITFREALKYLGQALVRGASLLGDTWRTKLQEEIKASYFEILEIIGTFDDPKKKLKEMYQVLKLLPDGEALSALARYHIADVLFKESVCLLEKGEYQKSLGLLHDIHQPVEEALSILRKGKLAEQDLEADEVRVNLEVIQQDAQFQICTAESMQARKYGEAMLVNLLDEEVWNMDMVWDAVDWFKQATLKAAELNLEQEAAALSYLGLINEKILLIKTKTKVYYKRCLELVEAAKPRTFIGHKWYTQCVVGFKKIQDEERWRDEAAQQEIKQKVLDTLKDEITALKKANTSAVSLVKYLLDHHPSRNSSIKFTKTHLDQLKETEGRNDKPTLKQRKKLLLGALQDYHTDKVVKSVGETEEQVQNRKVFLEEITKMITAHYEKVKLKT